MKITNLKGNPIYFSSKTVEDKPTRLKIQDVEVRLINENDRVVLVFEAEERDLKLTARQVSVLSRFWGDEADEWKGKSIDLSKGEDEGLSVVPVSEGK